MNASVSRYSMPPMAARRSSWVNVRARADAGVLRPGAVG